MFFNFKRNKHQTNWIQSVDWTFRSVDQITKSRSTDQVFNLEIEIRTTNQIFDMEIKIWSAGRITNSSRYSISRSSIFDLEIVTGSADSIFDVQNSVR